MTQKCFISRSLWTMIISVLICCKNEQPLEQLPQKEYGAWFEGCDTVGVTLDLNHYVRWKDLLKRVIDLNCQDSIARIAIKSDSVVKTVYIHNQCRGRIYCMRMNNILDIHNDTITKNHKIYPIDSLEVVLKKDILNNRKEYGWADGPYHLALFVSYDDDKMNRLPNLLDQLTDIYEKYTNDTYIDIWFGGHVEEPPPPPPAPLKE